MSEIKIGKASLLTTRKYNFADQYAETQRLATEYQSPEIQRKLRIAEAAEAAFEEYFMDGYQTDRKIESIDELLQWHEGRNKE